MTDNLPTARTMLPQNSWLCLFVRCQACGRRGPADLQAIIDAGQSDRPLKDPRFRCAKCGSRLTDWVVMSRDAMLTVPIAPARLATYEGSDRY